MKTFTIREAAKHIRMDEHRLRDAVRDGQIAHHDYGGTRGKRIREDALYAYQDGFLKDKLGDGGKENRTQRTA